jgi:hypothetical protein
VRQSASKKYLKNPLLWRFFVALFFIAVEAAAQPRAPATPQAAASAFALPQATPGAITSLHINSQNASQFKTLIIPELYPLVKNGSADFSAVNNLLYSWRYDDEFIRNSLAANGEALLPDGGLKAGTQIKRGFVLGVSDALKQETNPARFAQKVLWDVESTLWAQGALDLGLDLMWFKNQGLAARLNGVLTRVYLPILAPDDTTGQIFREMLKFQSPASISALTFLTFRFPGQEEDALWLYSPAVKKTRELTGSNRADPLMRSAVSLDDLFGWSGKLEWVEPVLDKSLVALVPFPSLSMAELDKMPGEPNCWSVKEPLSIDPLLSDASRWSLDMQNRTFSNFPVPAGTLFVPRQLWRLELNPRDPFSLYGRQVLYIDPAIMLPVYKVVYTRSGSLWKLAVTSWGLAAGKDLARKAPYPSFTLINDLQKNEFSVVDYIQPSFCDAFTEQIKLSNFDPTKLGPPAPEPTAAPAAAPKTKR